MKINLCYAVDKIFISQTNASEADYFSNIIQHEGGEF